MSTTKNTAKLASVGVAFGVGLTLAVIPAANAATTGDLPPKNSLGQCLIDTKTSTTHYPEQSHEVITTTPGVLAVTEPQELWGRDVATQEAVWVQLTQYFRTEQVPTHVNYDQWSYKRWVEGLKEESHFLYQFSRLNPGHKETFTDYYKYQQVIPAKDGVKTFNWTRVVDDYKVKYQYQKFVSGVVQVKKPYGGWQNTGGVFDWSKWDSYQWSYDNKDILESGPHSSQYGPIEVGDDGLQYRKLTTKYQYTKTGVTEQVKTGSHTETQWGTEKPAGDGWKQTGQWDWAIKPQPEQTILYQDGAFVKDNPGAPWVPIDHESRGNNDAVAPFEEWRAQDGSATPNQAEAGKFEQSSFDGWTALENPEKVVTQWPTESKWVYLTRDADGNLIETDDPTKAGLFTEADPAVDPQYIEFNRTTETKEGEPVTKTIYLSGVEGDLDETENPEDASWFNVKYQVPEGWQTVKDAEGNPVLDTELVSGEIPGHFEYYLPGGEPTLEQSDANWFNPNKTDHPSTKDGWRLIDHKIKTLKEAIPDKIEKSLFIDKAAWDDSKKEGVYRDCTLAVTGSDGWGTAGLAGLGLLVVGGGAALVVAQTRRSRRLEATQSAGVNS